MDKGSRKKRSFLVARRLRGGGVRAWPRPFFAGLPFTTYSEISAFLVKSNISIFLRVFLFTNRVQYGIITLFKFTCVEFYTFVKGWVWKYVYELINECWNINYIKNIILKVYITLRLYVNIDIPGMVIFEMCLNRRIWLESKLTNQGPSLIKFSLTN